MNFKGHIITGLIFFFFTIAFGAYTGYIPFSWKTLLLGLPIALYASILPDIDIHSWARKITMVGLAIIGGIAEYLGKYTWIVYICFIVMGGLHLLSHRGITHTWFFASCMALLTYLGLGWTYALFVLVGFAAHLCADKIPTKII